MEIFLWWIKTCSMFGMNIHHLWVSQATRHQPSGFANNKGSFHKVFARLPQGSLLSENLLRWSHKPTLKDSLLPSPMSWIFPKFPKIWSLKSGSPQLSSILLGFSRKQNHPANWGTPMTFRNPPNLEVFPSQFGPSAPRRSPRRGGPIPRPAGNSASTTVQSPVEAP